MKIRPLYVPFYAYPIILFRFLSRVILILLLRENTSSKTVSSTAVISAACGKRNAKTVGNASIPPLYKRDVHKVLSISEQTILFIMVLKIIFTAVAFL